MRLHTALLTSLVFVGTSTHSQTRASLDGSWAGTVKETNGNQTQVELKVANAAGAWRITLASGAPSRNQNPCANRDLPISVRTNSATDLVIQIEGAQVIRGCLNQTASFKSADGNSLEGSFADGRVVNLKRH
ncbi:MAG: hypothetical protein ACK543_12570 [Acidovorax sp.]